MREKYEFLRASISKSRKYESEWEVISGGIIRTIYIPIGDLDQAKHKLMDELGQEGWFLGSVPGKFYRFYMQRKIEE